jgi:hypothetical protein
MLREKKTLDDSEMGMEEGEEEEKDMFFYYVELNRIQPNNEYTKKRREQNKELEMKRKKIQDEEDRRKKEDNQKRKEETKLKEDREKMKQERRKMQEIKRAEEIEELKDFQGNFAITVLKIRANDTGLELMLPGNEFSAVQRRLVYKALEKNDSIKVKKIPLKIGLYIEQKILDGRRRRRLSPLFEVQQKHRETIFRVQPPRPSILNSLSRDLRTKHIPQIHRPRRQPLNQGQQRKRHRGSLQRPREKRHPLQPELAQHWPNPKIGRNHFASIGQEQKLDHDGHREEPIGGVGDRPGHPEEADPE